MNVDVCWFPFTERIIVHVHWSRKCLEASHCFIFQGSGDNKIWLWFIAGHLIQLIGSIPILMPHRRWQQRTLVLFAWSRRNGDKSSWVTLLDWTRIDVPIWVTKSNGQNLAKDRSVCTFHYIQEPIQRNRKTKPLAPNRNLNLHTRPITLLAVTPGPPSSNLRRRLSKTRRHIQSRVTSEEVPGSKEHGHRLSRHDRVIFRRGEMCQAKCVPEHDVCVVDGGVGTGFFDPGW